MGDLNVNPEEMPHNAASPQSLHYLHIGKKSHCEIPMEDPLKCTMTIQN